MSSKNMSSKSPVGNFTILKLYACQRHAVKVELIRSSNNFITYKNLKNFENCENFSKR